MFGVCFTCVILNNMSQTSVASHYLNANSDEAKLHFSFKFGLTVDKSILNHMPLTTKLAFLYFFIKRHWNSKLPILFVWAHYVIVHVRACVMFGEQMRRLIHMCLSAHMYRQISKCTDKNPKKHYWGGGGSCPPPPPLATLMRVSAAREHLRTARYQYHYAPTEDCRLQVDERNGELSAAYAKAREEVLTENEMK